MAELEQAGLRRIEPEALPDLNVLTGVFGCRADGPRFDAEDDNHAVLMPCLFPFALLD
ncbi:hypothetical protein [Novosphingobium album (ex Hu et al. 2023)]|uniref:Uncharacterized protein n=1 Tax=Novosphingobium album (ex Hu et al. 2023) TaxID=2930093 RepID=A0ABT0B0J1_9SPHN|nr:hypothetical protein [Novosphingobium album (ex Hu et al. 2023)]MCJ2178564.1 hypothetical protein [Novosphingobium album (ex Hu et al. 2023)]